MIDGIYAMLLFGLGTLPALVLVAFTGSWLGQKFSGLIPKAVTGIALVSGLLLVIRGLLITSHDFNELVQAKAAGLITICGL